MKALAKQWPTARILAHDPFAQFAAPSIDSREPEPGDLLLLDEVDLLCNPAGYTERYPVREWVHYCRHMQLTIVAASRRPPNIHRDLTALADVVYLGQITEPRDIDYCVRYFGETARDAPALAPYQFIELTL